MDPINIPELVDRLRSDEDHIRKMAAFKLQSAIGDPSFADVFILEGGLPCLSLQVLHATGNTLAYSLTSFSRLLELDKGWDCVTSDLIGRAVDLIVSHPLVNILRGAMSILCAVVSHPHNRSTQSGMFGFRALKPAMDGSPQFLEMLVNRLSSADHSLCANALQLINALMRDSMAESGDSEWPSFIKKLQDLGVIRTVYGLMRGSALQDLAHPALEFQSLTKILMSKWRDVRIDLEKQDHRRALKGLHLASNLERSTFKRSGENRKHPPDKWRRLGFETEPPVSEFDSMGFLGLMDLSNYVRKNEDTFQKLLLEQSTKTVEQRCPLARASLAVTSILYYHFEVEKADDDSYRYVVLESRKNFDKVFQPLLLRWARLHKAGLNAFLHLWKQTGAESEDFEKVEELVRILIEQVVGQAPRVKDIRQIEEEMGDVDYQKLRKLQMELLELTYENAWGHHLRQVRNELNYEALQFMKEQRIRCLLQGAWFPLAIYSGDNEVLPIKNENGTSGPLNWRYVQLSHNRRHLHYSDFNAKVEKAPLLCALESKVDLSTVSSVVSNVSASPPSASSSTTTLKTPRTTSTKITIHGYSDSTSSTMISTSATSTTSATDEEASDINDGVTGEIDDDRIKNGTAVGSSTNSGTQHKQQHQDTDKYTDQDQTQDQQYCHHSQRRPRRRHRDAEKVLLELHPSSHTLASEWLDGLLMLLNQQPITAESNKLLRLISRYGLKIRLLNLSFDHLSFDEPVLPSRDALDDNYWYDIGGIDAGL